MSVGPSGLCVGSKRFNVGRVVTGSDQATAYEAVALPLLQQLEAGYSCTLLAYGQTGSGKTHTVFGPPGSLTESSVAQARGMWIIEGVIGCRGVVAWQASGSVPADWGLFPRIVMQASSNGVACST